MKIIKCSKCKQEFKKISTRTMCIVCNKNYNQSNKEHIKEYNKKRYENNKDVILSKIKKYHKNNEDKIKKYTKEWFNLNKKHINEYNKKKYNDDLHFKLKLTLRNSLNKKLKSHKKDQSSLLLIGCSIEELKLYLEKQFKPEMTWENHGEIWEIDHIKPCISFDLTDIKQQQECFHYTNLQPLFKTTKIAENFGYTDQIGNRNKYKN